MTAPAGPPPAPTAADQGRPDLRRGVLAAQELGRRPARGRPSATSGTRPTPCTELRRRGARAAPLRRGEPARGHGRRPARPSPCPPTVDALPSDVVAAYRDRVEQGRLRLVRPRVARPAGRGPVRPGAGRGGPRGLPGREPHARLGPRPGDRPGRRGRPGPGRHRRTRRCSAPCRRRAGRASPSTPPVDPGGGRRADRAARELVGPDQPLSRPGRRRPRGRSRSRSSTTARPHLRGVRRRRRAAGRRGRPR